MGYKDPSYVIFDGDEDKWAYAFMKGWKANQRMDFDFRDAHDLDNMTARAQGEAYVKRNLRARMEKSSAVVVLVGEYTKNLYKYVRWELELALDLELPIIAVNLNEKNGLDENLCPALIRNECVVHVPFKMAALRLALDSWPDEFYSLSAKDREKGARSYSAETIKNL